MKADPRVLIVEDEFLIANALQLVLQKLGARVLGPAARVSTALELITGGTPFDCALLDIRLGDELVYPVADELRARGVRFAFVSGYDRSTLPAAYQDATFFSKVEDPKVLYRWVLEG